MAKDLSDALTKMKTDYHKPDDGWHIPASKYADLSQYIEAVPTCLQSKVLEVKDLTASIKRCATVFEKDAVEMLEFLNSMGTHRLVK